jgi:hypothetical protein
MAYKALKEFVYKETAIAAGDSVEVAAEDVEALVQDGSIESTDSPVSTETPDATPSEEVNS